MALKHSTGAANAALAQGFATIFDAAAGSESKINLYTGTQPASADNAVTGTLLGTLTMSADAVGTPANRSVSINAVTSDTSADASGVAGYFVMYKNADTLAASTTAVRLSGTVGGRTTLSADPTATGTTLTVANTGAFPTAGTLIVENEQITYTGKTATTFTGCTRGANGTTAAAHAAGVTVTQANVDLTIDGDVQLGGVLAVSGWTYTFGA